MLLWSQSFFSASSTCFVNVRNGIYALARNYSAADSIRQLLKTKGFPVAGIDKYAADAKRWLQTHTPSAVVVGSELIDATGLEMMRIVREKHPKARRVLYVCETDLDYAKAVLDEGVHGLLSPDALVDDLIACMKTVMAGGHYVFGRHREALERRFGTRAFLSDREMEILELVKQGLTSRRVADRLHISIHTVGNHRCNMMRKLGLQGPKALENYVIKQRLPKR